jgi:hypothetical protein
MLIGTVIPPLQVPVEVIFGSMPGTLDSTTVIRDPSLAVVCHKGSYEKVYNLFMEASVLFEVAFISL